VFDLLPELLQIIVDAFWLSKALLDALRVRLLLRSR